MTGFGFRKVAVVSLGMCLAAVACGDDGTDTPGESSAGAAGKAVAGASNDAGAKHTAGEGGMNSAGDGSSAGADSTGGTTPTAGTGGTTNGGGDTSQGGQANAGAGGAAAGEGGTGNGGAPAAPAGAGAGGQPDDVDGGAGGEGGQASSCVVASYGDVEATDGYAFFDADTDVTLLNLRLQDGTPRDEVEVELWDGYGTFADGLAPGTYEIDGANLDYYSCTLCVVLYDQVNEFGGDRGWYMATGGTVTLTSVEGNLTGSLSNVTFQHVYEDNGGHSVPWGDGCMTSLEAIDFDTEITDL